MGYVQKISILLSISFLTSLVGGSWSGQEDKYFVNLIVTDPNLTGDGAWTHKISSFTVIHCSTSSSSLQVLFWMNIICDY